ncbi:MAG TPA: hypothetical protein VFB89_04725, partial [Gemmatimonadales bacterium]|nr:hypothetical protein [Gemmatimonadales bacterium]
LREAASRQVQLNEAVRTFAPGPLLSNIQDLKREMGELKALEQSGFLGRILSFFSKGISGLGGLTGLGRGPAEIDIQKQRLAYEQAAGPGRESELLGISGDLAKLAQQRAALYGTPAEQFAAINEITRGETRRAEIARDQAILQGPGTMGFREHQEAIFAGRSRLFGGQAGLARRQISDALFERFYLGGGEEQYQPGQGLEQVSAGMAASAPIDISRAQQIGEDIRRQIIDEITGQMLRENAEALSGGAEQIGVGPTASELAAAAPRFQAARVQELDVQKQLFDVRSSFVGLTREEREQLEKITIEMQKQADIAAAGNDEALKDLAEARAAMAQINLELLKIERTDAFAGLAKGVKSVGEEWSATGKTMQDFARSTASSMQRSFSDLFFNAMTGNFKSLADVGKSFMLSIARDISNSLSQQLTGSIYQGLGSFFPNQSPGSPGFFGNAVTGSAVTAGQGGVAGISQAAGFGTGYAGYFTGSSPEAGAPGGGFGVGLGEGEGVGYGSALAGGAVGGIVGAAGIGLQYTGSKRDARAGQGILTGASLGGSVGGIYGMAIGAIVGLFASAATQDLKDREEATKAGIHRGDAFNIRRLQPYLTGDIQRVQSASTFLELAGAIQGAMHPAFGGPSSRGGGRRGGVAGFAVSIDGETVVLPGGSYPVTMTLTEFADALRDNGDTFRAALQLGINEAANRQISDAYAQAVRDRVSILGTFESFPVAYSEVGVGIERRTILPVGALDRVQPGTQNLSISRVLLSSTGLVDADTDMLIRRIRSRNSQTDAIRELDTEPFYRT